VFKIFIYTFNLSNQRLRRYTSGIIYAGSYGKTIFHFNFNTPDWDISPTKTAVFSYRGKNYPEDLDENNMCRVPKEVLHEGYFQVSVQDGQGLLTNNVRVPVSPIPEELMPDIPGGNSGPSMVYVPEITPDNMLVFTLTDEPTEERLEFDIDKSNDWSETDNTMGSNYIWEPMK
jgi:hypothetical protein